MGIETSKAYTPGRRHASFFTFEELTSSEPQKALLKPRKQKAGRNHSGRITVRHRGGGHKRKIRIIDFKRDKFNIPAKVLTIEYDPMRSARICLVCYADGEKRYILHPLGLSVGDTIVSSDQKVSFNVGNAMPLKYIPDGTLVHNIETYPGSGGRLARSAGSYAQIMAKIGNYALLKMRSKEERLIHSNCLATIGQVGNVEHENISLGKAGRSRWLGVRPYVRGVAMNPVDHPHGGGEGRCPQGNPHPTSPTGKVVKGEKTRIGKRYSDKFIIKTRKGQVLRKIEIQRS